jgi:hypothetical protein
MSGGSLDHFLPWPSTRSESFAPIPVCWPTLDSTEAQGRLEELADWISWLHDRYTLDYRTIPPCWASHGALVEELQHCAPHGSPPTHKTPEEMPRFIGTPTSPQPANASATGPPAPAADQQNTDQPVHNTEPFAPLLTCRDCRGNGVRGPIAPGCVPGGKGRHDRDTGGCEPT